MQKEAPKFGKIYDAIPTSPRLDVSFQEEDHSFIPGQKGPAEIKISELILDSLTLSTTINRRNSFVPSNDTVYFYEKDEFGKAVLVKTKSHLFDENSFEFLVEQVKIEGSEPVSETFPDHSEIKELLDAFSQPKPGESPDLTPTLEKARKVKHPSIRFPKDGDEEVLLISDLHRNMEDPNFPLIVMVANVIRFVKNGDKIQISSLVSRSLIGVSDESLQPSSIRKEFFYTDGSMMKRRQYIGGELNYTDRCFPQTFSIGGRDFQFVEFERELGDFNKKQTGREKENWRAVALDPKTGRPTRYMPDYTGIFCIIPSAKK